MAGHVGPMRRVRLAEANGRVMDGVCVAANGHFGALADPMFTPLTAPPNLLPYLASDCRASRGKYVQKSCSSSIGTPINVARSIFVLNLVLIRLNV